MNQAFILRKMKTALADQTVSYTLDSDGQILALNPLLGQTLRLEATGRILCIACGRKTAKSFQQGYCFPCARTLAQCDMCIVRPELCHYAAGTCREPSWGEEHCLIPHVVYLANSSGIKVGITRAHQRTTRWIDQGASQAIVLGTVGNRLDSGKIEVQLKSFFPDKTNWRIMLKGEAAALDLEALRREALLQVSGAAPWNVSVENTFSIQYPVLKYPKKITSLNLEKTPRIEGQLLGIKAQYLIFDKGVINIRSYAGYEVGLQALD